MCGEPTLDDWLRRRARSNQTAGASRTYVLAINDRVVGYYSIAAGAIAISEAPSWIRRNSRFPWRFSGWRPMLLMVSMQDVLAALRPQ
jgi:hypothetical protein